MKDNWNVKILGNNVLLIPYKKEFVERYHEWMKDPHILQMTASEPLSLVEEFKMQEDWLTDPNKCTFIIAQKSSEHSLIESIAGDVNFFFNDLEDPKRVEVDVMIGEATYRRRGYAKEAVSLAMMYAVLNLGVQRFYCKINQANLASLTLFKRLGFVEVNYVEAFDEYELAYDASSSSEREEVINRVSYSIIGEYCADEEI